MRRRVTNNNGTYPGAKEARLAGQLYSQPTTASICQELPIIGEQLDGGCARLAKFTSIENADALLARLETAKVTVQRLRQRLVEEVR